MFFDELTVPSNSVTFSVVMFMCLFVPSLLAAFLVEEGWLLTCGLVVFEELIPPLEDKRET